MHEDTPHIWYISEQINTRDLFGMQLCICYYFQEILAQLTVREIQILSIDCEAPKTNHQ